MRRAVRRGSRAPPPTPATMRTAAATRLGVALREHAPGNVEVVLQPQPRTCPPRRSGELGHRHLEAAADARHRPVGRLRHSLHQEAEVPLGARHPSRHAEHELHVVRVGQVSLVEEPAEGLEHPGVVDLALGDELPLPDPGRGIGANVGRAFHEDVVTEVEGPMFKVAISAPSTREPSRSSTPIPTAPPVEHWTTTSRPGCRHNLPEVLRALGRASVRVARVQVDHRRALAPGLDRGPGNLVRRVRPGSARASPPLPHHRTGDDGLLGHPATRERDAACPSAPRWVAGTPRPARPGGRPRCPRGRGAGRPPCAPRSAWPATCSSPRG